MSDLIYDPFLGDGRVKVQPTIVLPFTKPIGVTRGQARMLIDSFRQSGNSAHSGMGGTLWVILSWVQYQKIPYRLTAHPRQGYYVERIEPSELPDAKP